MSTNQPIDDGGLAFVPPIPGSCARWPKIDARPMRGWWAPGEYACRCHHCLQYFIGDKRAAWCADCAYSDAAMLAARKAAL